jgi:hypothetical protein
VVAAKKKLSGYGNIDDVEPMGRGIRYIIISGHGQDIDLDTPYRWHES